MSLTAEWTVDVDGMIEAVAYHDGANAATVALKRPSPAGPAILTVSATDGSRLGLVETTQVPSAVEYDAALDLLIGLTIDDRLYAIDPETGEERWNATTEGGEIATATGDSVILQGESGLWSHRASDGTVQWRAELPDSIVESARYHRGNVVAAVGGYEDMGLVAIDADTGDRRWYYRPEADAQTRITEAGLYASFDGGGRETDLSRIDDANGTEQWTYAAETEYFTAYYEPNRIFLTDDKRAIALDPASGDRRWITDQGETVSRLWPDQEHWYVSLGTSTSDQGVAALDPETGQLRWKAVLDRDPSALHEGGPAGSEAVFVATNQHTGGGGTLYRLDASTGQIGWEFDVGSSSFVVRGDADPILTKSMDDVLHGIDRESGDAVWSFSEETLSLREASDERLLVSAGDVRYVLNRSDGAVALSLSNAVGDKTPYATGGGLLFVGEGDANVLGEGEDSLAAYSLSRRPDAVRRERAGGDSDIARDPGTAGGADDRADADDTEVYDPADADDTEVYDPADADNTEVYGPEGSSGAGEDPSDQSPAVSFCPSCGADLGGFDDTDFCPGCGTELPR